jgi:ADP-L-glycero-D-manno-heptose 6-epimerase
MGMMVTGAGGFIGSRLAFKLERHHKVVAVDDFSLGSRENLEGFKGKVISADFSTLRENDLEDVECVFHQGAISDPTFPDEERIMKVNCDNALAFMQMCRDLSIPFIYASSAAVYGNSQAPNKEFESEAPHNAYARSKLALDMGARKLWGKTPIIGLRYFNVYGPGEERKGKTVSIVWNFMKEVHAGRSPVIYGDGTQKRDFVYIKDVVRANLLAFESEVSGVFNVGSGVATDFTTLANTISEVYGKDLPPAYHDNPYSKGYQFHTQADLSNAQKIGYSPEYDLETGIQDYREAMGHV